MPTNEVLIKNGTPIVWANTSDYGDAVWTRTRQIDLTSLANGAARQGQKADLLSPRAGAFTVRVVVEPDVAPSSGATSEIYFGFSGSGTAGTDNPAGLTGADGAYTGTTGDSLADSVKALSTIPFIYLHTSDVAPIVLPQDIGILYPILEWVSPVIVNSSGQAYEGDAIEMYIALIPIPDEVQ